MQLTRIAPWYGARRAGFPAIRRWRRCLNERGAWVESIELEGGIVLLWRNWSV